jgi:hypothetical protein
MKKNRLQKMIAIIFLSLAAGHLSGCALIPLAPFAGSVAGSAYGGYTVWKESEVTRYFASDLDTAFRAVKLSSEQMKLEPMVLSATPGKEYALYTEGNYPMKITLLPVEKHVTKVVVSIGIAGDKQYVDFFFKSIETNLSKLASSSVKKP